MSVMAVFSARARLQMPRLWFWLGVLLTASIILLSLINPPSVVASIVSSDKLAHMFAYAVLMGWFGQIFEQTSARLTLAIVFVGMGVGLEYLQGMVPFRQFDVLDMVANSIGVLLAWLLVYTRMGSILLWFERTLLRLGSASA